MTIDLAWALPLLFCAWWAWPAINEAVQRHMTGGDDDA